MALKLAGTRAGNIFSRRDMENGEKVNLFLVPENFQGEVFSGPVPTESLRTQDPENIVGLGDPASVPKL